MFAICARKIRNTAEKKITTDFGIFYRNSSHSYFSCNQGILIIPRGFQFERFTLALRSNQVSAERTGQRWARYQQRLPRCDCTESISFPKFNQTITTCSIKKWKGNFRLGILSAKVLCSAIIPRTSCILDQIIARKISTQCMNK